MNNSNSSNNNKDVGYSDGICNGRGPLYHPPAGQKYQLLLFFSRTLYFSRCVSLSMNRFFCRSWGVDASISADHFFFRRSTHKTQVEAIYHQRRSHPGVFIVLRFKPFGYASTFGVLAKRQKPTNIDLSIGSSRFPSSKWKFGSSCPWFSRYTWWSNQWRGKWREGTSTQKIPGEATTENHGTLLRAWSLESGDKEQRDTSIALRPWNGRSIWDQQKV